MPITINFAELVAVQGWSRQLQVSDIRSRGQVRMQIVLSRAAWQLLGNATVRVWAVRS